MSCPNAPDRGHNAGSARGRECQYCGPAQSTYSAGSSSPNTRLVQLMPTHGAANTSSGARVDATLKRVAEQFIGALLTSDSDKRAYEITSILLNEALAVSGISKPRDNSHFLCELLETFVVDINALLEIPDLVVDHFVDQFEPRWLPATISKKVLKSLVNAVIELNPGIEALRLLALKVAALAMAFCPNPDEHTSLDINCGLPLFNAGKSIAGQETSEQGAV